MPAPPDIVIATPSTAVISDGLTVIYALVTAFLTTFGTIALAWIGYKQAQLTTAMRELHTSTNSKMDLLMKTAIEAAEARGALRVVTAAQDKIDVEKQAVSDYREDPHSGG